MADTKGLSMSQGLLVPGPVDAESMKFVNGKYVPWDSVDEYIAYKDDEMAEIPKFKTLVVKQSDGTTRKMWNPINERQFVPEQDTVRGSDGYTPIKGVDYNDGEKGEDGKTPSLKIEGGLLKVSYDNTIWTSLGKVVGNDGVSPKFKIENNYLNVSYDNGATWQELSECIGEKGEDGLTPIFKLEEGFLYNSYDNGTNWIKLGYVNGIDGFNPVKGVDYTDGVDGVSPTITTSKEGNVTTLVIEDKNGIKRVEIIDSVKGDDGFSPIVSLSKTGNKATLTVTDKNGTSSVNIYDGQSSVPTVDGTFTDAASDGKSYFREDGEWKSLQDMSVSSDTEGLSIIGVDKQGNGCRITANALKKLLGAETIINTETKTGLGKGIDYVHTLDFDYPIPAGATLNIPEVSHGYAEVYINDSIYFKKQGGTIQQGSTGEQVYEDEIHSISYKSYNGYNMDITVSYETEFMQTEADIISINKKIGNLADIEAVSNDNVVSAINEILDILGIKLITVSETKSAVGNGVGDVKEFGFTYPIPAGATLIIPEVNTQYCSLKVNGTSILSKAGGTISKGHWGTYTIDYEITSVEWESYQGVSATVQIEYTKRTIGSSTGSDDDNNQDSPSIGAANVGNLDNLKTSAKDTVVSAINEVVDAIKMTELNVHEEKSATGLGVGEKVDVPLIYPIPANATITIPECASGYAEVYVNDNTILKKTGGITSVGTWGEQHFPYEVTSIKFQSYPGFALSVTVDYDKQMLSIENDVETLNSSIGDLSKLKAEDKSSIVNAVNEAFDSIPKLNVDTEWIAYNGNGNMDGITYECKTPIEQGEKFWIDDNGSTDGNTPGFSCYRANYVDGTNENVVLVQGSRLVTGAWGEQTAKKKIISFTISSYTNWKHNVRHNISGIDISTFKSKVAPNRLFGKKWLLLGDSISTEGAEFSTYGYGTCISNSLGLNKVNTAVGGQTLETIFNQQLKPASRDFHIITCMGGTNDAGYHVGTTKTRQVVSDMIDYIRANYPKTFFMFISPIRRWGVGEAIDGVPVDLEKRMQDTKEYADTIREVCESKCVPFCDLWNVIAPEITEQREKYFIGTHTSTKSDGTHPNALGHEMFIAPVIEDALLKHAPFYFNDFE